MSLRDKIKQRVIYALAGGPRMPSEELERLAWECTDAALRALRPDPVPENTEPVILYFPTAAEREEFIAAMVEAKPGMIPVRVD